MCIAGLKKKNKHSWVINSLWQKLPNFCFYFILGTYFNDLLKANYDLYSTALFILNITNLLLWHYLVLMDIIVIVIYISFICMSVGVCMSVYDCVSVWNCVCVLE